MPTSKFISWFQTRSFRSVLSLFLCVVAVTFCFNYSSKKASAACSTTLTWTGTDAAMNNGWSDANNWGGCTLVSGDQLVFPDGLSGAQLTSNNDTSLSGFYLHFSGSNFVISGTEIHLGSAFNTPIIFEPGVTTDTVTAPLTLPAAAGDVYFSEASSSNYLNLEGTIDLNGDNLVFTTDGTIDILGKITDSGSVTNNSSDDGVLIFDNASNDYTGTTTVNGGTLQITKSTALGTADGTDATAVTVNSGGQLSLDGSGFNVVNKKLILNGLGPTANGAFVSFGGLNTWGGNIHLGSDSDFVALDPSDTLVIAGNIDGSGGIGAQGHGRLELEGTDTYGGATQIGTISGAGGLEIDSPASIPSATDVTVATGATLFLNSSTGDVTLGSLAGGGNVPLGTNKLTTGGDNTNTEFDGVLSGTGGGFVKTGTGTFTLGGTNTFTGPVTINNGTVDVKNNAAFGDVGNTVTVNNGGQIALDGGSAGVSVSQFLNLNGSGPGGTGALYSKSGLGLDNWYGDIDFQTTSDISVDSGNNLFLNATLEGAGGFNIIGGGALFLNNTSATASNFTGPVEVKNGSLRDVVIGGLGDSSGVAVDNAGSFLLAVSGTNSFNSTPLFLNGGNFGSFLGNNTWTGPVTLSADTDMFASPGTAKLKISNTISGSHNVTINGNTHTGTVVFSTANTYNGTTEVKNGSLELGNNNALGASSVTTVDSGGQLVLDNGVAIASEPLTLNGLGPGSLGALLGIGASVWNGPITLNATSNVEADGTDTLEIGHITGAGGLVKVGTGNVEFLASTANDYSGVTTIAAGKLELVSSTGLPSTTALAIFSGATLDASSGSIAPTVASLAGTGTLVLGTNTFNAGNISPGPIGIGTGILTVTGGNLNSTGNFTVQLEGTTAGSGYDQLLTSGTVTLNTTTLVINSGFTSSKGNFFNIISGGNIHGTFNGEPGGTVLAVGSRHLEIDYGSFVTLTDVIPVAPAPPAPPSSPSSGGGGGGGGGQGGGSILQLNQGPGSSSTNSSSTTSTTSSPSTSNQTPPPTSQTAPSTSQSGLHGAAPSNPSTQPASTSSSTLTNFFTDTAGHWAEQDIDQILNTCKVAGYQDPQGNLLRIFKPDNDLTRAELMTMLMKCKVGVLPAVSSAPFSDVPANHWAAPYIAKGVQMGLVQGYSDGTFKPNQTISRAEALKIILLAWFTADDINASAQNSSCTDITGSAWYVQFFYFALNRGFLGGAQGNNSALCRPDSMMTRAESASSIVKIRLQPVAFSPLNLALRVTLLHPVSRFAASNSGTVSDQLKTDQILHGFRRPQGVKRLVS